MDYSNAEISSIRSTEAQPRLISLLGPLGIAKMSSAARQRFLEVLSRGLKLHSKQEPSAMAWAKAISEIGSIDFLESDPGQKQPRPDFSLLAQTILEQPASFLPPQDQDDALAFAAKAALVICLKLLTPDPHQTCHSVRQLFKSKTSDWALARRQLYIEGQHSTGDEKTAQVVLDFLEQKQRYLTTPIPPLESFVKRVDTSYKTLAEAPTAEPPLSPTLPPKANNPVKEPDNTSPNFHLFETQILRAVHPDVSDPYRLPLNWNRLSSLELYPTIQRLLAQLRQDGDANFATRLHSAARFVSFFAGLSLKTCMQLPISRHSSSARGSMHLDLNCGVLRRDALCAAPRKKRAGKVRTNGRWWRIPLPPEICLVLLEAAAKNPEARSLGDLIRAAGLDHESCQHLLNDGFPTSHRPEDARFACSFRTYLLDLGIHPALVARASGDTITTPFSDHYYLTFTTHQIAEVMVTFCNWVGLNPPRLPAKNRSIGSPKAIAREEFRSLVRCLNQTVLSARNKITSRSSINEVVEFHNLYSKAFALQLILAHGGRANLIGRLTFARLFACNDFLAFSDRRTDPYSKQRILPLTSIFKEGNGRYREHMHAVSKRMAEHSAEQSTALDDLSEGRQLHSCAFPIFEKSADGWLQRSQKRSDLVELLAELGQKIGMQLDQESLNIGRHFWHTELVIQEVAQPAIEAFLGHHTIGAEVFGYGSGVSVREVCDYLRPIIDSIQSDIGFTPLVGLGRTADRYFKLPEIPVQKNLRPLPSKLLLHKLAHQDLAIPDLTLQEQDPPSTGKTLVAYTTLESLKVGYSKAACLSTHSLGSTLFCFIAMELVLTEAEQRALFLAAVGDGLWRIGALVVVEAEDEGRPIAQRLLQEQTQAAVIKVRLSGIKDLNSDDSIVAQATEDLHDLLVELEPSWPCKTPSESVRLLSIIASHWSAVEIAPGTMFGVYHKAPFIPAIDLSRIYYRQPRAHADKNTDEKLTSFGAKEHRFRDTDKILSKWANKDIPLGESVSRAERCSNDLNAFLSRTDLTLAERLHAELLVADLSASPPYKKLDASTLPSYSNKYQLFFKIVEEEDSCDLQPEHFQQAFTDMGGGESMAESKLPRWAMLHICAFLEQRGYWVPAALTAVTATKTPRPARIPVYSTAREIDLVEEDLVEYFAGAGGSYSFAPQRLKLERSVPLRAGELRYSRPIDFDLQHQLLHITTSGHNHLKTISSRGSVPLSAEIARSLEKLKSLREDIAIGLDTLMFPDVHLEATYRAFDEIADAIRYFTIQRTGCAEFRRHDFRACANSDICFPVQESIEAFAAGAFTYVNGSDWTAAQLTERFIRFAKAARFSRHASVATTLRFYNCSGPLDLYQQLRFANSRLKSSGIYASDVMGRSAQALYVRKDRQSDLKRVSRSASQVTFASLISEYLSEQRKLVPTPPLLGPSNQTMGRVVHERSTVSTSKLVQASLLAQSGMTMEVAAEALNIPFKLVENFQSRAATFVSDQIRGSENKDSTPAFSSRIKPDIPALPLWTAIAALSRWLTSFHGLGPRGNLPLRLAIGTSPSTLTVIDANHLLELLPMLRGVSHNGFRVLLRVASGNMLATNPQLNKKISDSGIEVFSERGKSRGLGTIYFCVRQPVSVDPSTVNSQLKSPDDIFPRSLGIAGRVVVSGLLLVLHCL
jgi:hypothetical protein